MIRKCGRDAPRRPAKGILLKPFSTSCIGLGPLKGMILGVKGEIEGYAPESSCLDSRLLESPLKQKSVDWYWSRVFFPENRDGILCKSTVKLQTRVFHLKGPKIWSRRVGLCSGKYSVPTDRDFDSLKFYVWMGQIILKVTRQVQVTWKNWHAINHID